MILPRVVLLFAAAFSLGGCAGYHLGPIKPKLFENVNTVAVNTFKNDTLEPRIEVSFANAVIKQIQQDGTYRVVREEQADALIEGTIIEIERRPVRSVRGNVLATREFELIIRARYRVTERATGRELDSRTVQGRTNFFVSGTDSICADTQQDERQAIPQATEELAVRLVSQISEGW